MTKETWSFTKRPSRAAIDIGAVRKGAVKLAEQGDVLPNLDLGAERCERGVAGERRAEHRERRRRQPLELRGRTRESVELVRPGEPRAQCQRPVAGGPQHVVGTQPEFAA